MDKDVDRFFNLNKKINYTSHSVFDSIETMSHAVHLKDAQTKKYILCNSRCAELMGIESANDLIGLTSDYFTEESGIWYKWNFSAPFKQWIVKQKVLVEELENQIRLTEKSVIGQKSLHFTQKGVIFVEKLTKQPILNGKKITAILSINLQIPQ